MKDSIIIAIDSLLQIDSAVVDTTTTISVAEAKQPIENGTFSQPNGWLQLSLPLLVAIFVVLLDKWIDRRNAKANAKETRKCYRNTVLDWIKNILPVEKTFSQSVHDLAKSVGESDDMQPQPFAMPLTMHDKLHEMTVEKMTEAFMHDFKDDKDKRYINMYNILSNFEYLNRITVGVMQSYDTYNKQSFALCGEWNALYDDLMVHFSKLPQSNPYNTIVTAWMVELMQKPNSVVVHGKYLNMLNLKAIGEKDVDTFTRINKLHRVVLQVQALNIGIGKNFSDMAANIDLTLNSLAEAEAYFRGEKVKF